MTLVLLALVAAHLSTAQTPPFAGAIPPAMQAARVIWIGADGGDAVPCTVADNRWRCEGISRRTGVVVIIADSTIAARITGSTGAGVDGAMHQWGRVVRITPGGVAPEDLHDLAASAWKPERSAVRPHAERLLPIEERSIQIVQLSGSTFWVAGDDAVADACVSVDGPAIGRTTRPVSALIESAPDTSVLVPACAPLSLTGRVVSSRLQPVPDAEVELFEPLRRGQAKEEDSAEMVRRAATRTDADGNFAFERLTPGSYTLNAAEPLVGRGTLVISSVAEPAVVRLTPPMRATGRVLRVRSPVPGARVRFVPDPAAFAAGTDASRFIADPTVTGSDGTFTLVLPPAHDGLVQIITPAGVSIRVPVSEPAKGADIALGDIDIPEPTRIAVRLLDAASCTFSAVGPLDGLGLAIVTASQTQDLYWFDLPEAGEWALNAECDGSARQTEPATIHVGRPASVLAIDVRLAKRPRQP
jgi:hypothetical protein